MTHVHLAAIIGRAVRHQQDFGARLGQRLADAEVVPDFLADRHADAHTAKIDRPRHFTFDEDALLVEFAVVRQVDLVPEGKDPPAVNDGDRIVPALLSLAGEADDHAWPAVGGIGGERLDRLQAGLEEGRLQHEVLRRIAGDEELGQKQQICPLPGRFGAGSACLGQIAGDVADDGIELCHRDTQDVGDLLCFAHDTDLAARLSDRNAASRSLVPLRAATLTNPPEIAGNKGFCVAVHVAFMTLM
jgi:hypothetical protein